MAWWVQIRQGVLIGLVGIFLYASSQVALKQNLRSDLAPELLVTLPVFAQVILGGGDRYLVANLMGFRVLVAETQRMSANDFAIQARLQRDVAWLNPAHEDNYFVASALLPWNQQVEAAQEVLAAAAKARPFDWTPMFYYGFNLYHFYRDPAAGAQSLIDASARASDQQEAWTLQDIAARWIERGYQTADAGKVVGALAAQSPPGGFRRYLMQRSERLQILARLQDAAGRYHEQFGMMPRRIENLVESGILATMPVDPLGLGFELDAGGNPVFKTLR